jgi:hypothetical protein
MKATSKTGLALGQLVRRCRHMDAAPHLGAATRTSAARAYDADARSTGPARNDGRLTLDIPKFLGSAELDEQGKVKSEERNDHQWRRVLFPHGRPPPGAETRPHHPRSAQDLDSSLAAMGLLFAKRQGEAVDALRRARQRWYPH